MFASFLAAVLSGLLLVAAFPRYDQGYLLFFALIPLFWALRGQSRRAGFWLGIVNGVTFYLGLLSWIFYVTYVYGHTCPCLWPWGRPCSWPPTCPSTGACGPGGWSGRKTGI